MTLDSVVSPQVLNKYLILVDLKSGRFKYQSGRAGDETKKRKSPAKSGRVGIYEKGEGWWLPEVAARYNTARCSTYSLQ